MNGFDPYKEWLGVPVEEQPANLYRLLGLPPFETEYVKITTAADQRMAKVKGFQKGPQATLSQTIIAELLYARVTLSDPKRRAAYDAVLRAAAPAVTCDVQTLPGAQPKRPAAEHDSLLGSRIDKYKVWERVSASPSGCLFKVQHVDTGRLYFLKNLPHEAEDDRELQKSFQREIEILTKLDHPHFICGRGSGFCDGQSYLILDYATGVDLAKFVELQGKVTPEEAVKLITQAARGLEVLHKQGIFHRNIRPQVLVIDVQGNLRVTNPLLAKLGEPTSLAAKQEQIKANTPTTSVYEYLAVEQFEDPRKADARSDIYALGCTLFFLLIGRPPYAGKAVAQQVTAHKNAPLPSLRNTRNDIPVPLDNVFVKMIAKQPSQRYANIKDLLEDLENSLKKGVAKPQTPDNLWVQWMKKLGIRK
jgi:serine/threonine protein kinase